MMFKTDTVIMIDKYVMYTEQNAGKESIKFWLYLVW